METIPFTNETGMRTWLIKEVASLLPSSWIVFHGKNVSDILVFRQDATAPLMLFVEAKYHQTKHARIPVGGAAGSGYQPEYLLRKPIYLERHLRWIIADEGTKVCVLMTNDEVRQNAANGIALGKFNNIKKRIFRMPGLNRFPLDDAPKYLHEWIIGFDLPS